MLERNAKRQNLINYMLLTVKSLQQWNSRTGKLLQ